jgi:hypothetical protein
MPGSPPTREMSDPPMIARPAAVICGNYAGMPPAVPSVRLSPKPNRLAIGWYYDSDDLFAEERNVHDMILCGCALFFASQPACRAVGVGLGCVLASGAAGGLCATDGGRPEKPISVVTEPGARRVGQGSVVACPRLRRQPYREALLASEAGNQRGGTLPVDERPELTIMLRMGGISLQDRGPAELSGRMAPRPSGSSFYVQGSQLPATLNQQR